jgi:hypothetical protein
MKKLVLIGLLLFMFVEARTQTAFSFLDSLVVTTTKKDTTFSTERFETFNIKFSGCDGLVRFAMSSQDTVGWDRQGPAAKMRHYILVDEGSVLSVSADKNLRVPGVYKLDVRTVSGSGIMYIFGTKNAGR